VLGCNRAAAFFLLVFYWQAKVSALLPDNYQFKIHNSVIL